MAKNRAFAVVTAAPRASSVTRGVPASAGTPDATGPGAAKSRRVGRPGLY
jgi:hypothetical protein